ncbi:MAG: PilZ domain-containing protein, partial [Rhodopila sp.]
RKALQDERQILRRSIYPSTGLRLQCNIWRGARPYRRTQTAHSDVEKITKISRESYNVVKVAEDASSASQEVMAGSSGIGTQAETLRAEVDSFLAAVRDDTGEKRRYERIPANGAVATLQAQGRSMKAALINVSRDGALIDCDWTLIPGTQLEIELPSAGKSIPARIVRRETNGLAVVFDADPSAVTRIDRALDAISRGRIAA